MDINKVKKYIVSITVEVVEKLLLTFLTTVVGIYYFYTVKNQLESMIVLKTIGLKQTDKEASPRF